MSAGIETRAQDGGVVFAVKVAAGASREGIAGQIGGMLKVHICVAREKGKANKALIKLLAKALGVGRGGVQILRGETATIKTIFVSNVNNEQVQTLLESK